MTDADPLGALSLLTEEPRLGIIETLAQADAERPGKAVMSFTELFEAQEMRDSGRFNYHLNKLCGVLVEEVEEGYRLSPAGHRLVAAVLSVSVEEPPGDRRTTLAEPCPVCGTAVTVNRVGNAVSVHCEEGHGFGEYVSPRMSADRDLRTLADLAAVRAVGSFREARHGLCPKCAGEMTWRFDPDAEGFTAADTARPTVATCQTCGVSVGGSPGGFVFFEPPVAAELAELGVDVWADPLEWLLRGGGGTIEAYDPEAGVVTSTFEFPAFTLTATVTTRTTLESFTFEPTDGAPG